MTYSRAETQANLEFIVREVEVLCKGVDIPKRKEKRGRPPVYSNTYLVKLAVLQHLLGFTSERSFLHFVQELQRPEFQDIPHHSQYNRRLKSLQPFINLLTKKLLRRLRIVESKVRIIDATPIPVVRIARASRRKIFTRKREAAIGYCASQKTYFCGFKLTLLINHRGVPISYDLIPGNEHDMFGLERLVELKKLWRIILIGDKGYINRFLKQDYRRTRHIVLVTPYRKNQKETNTKKERKLLKKRNLIETVIGQLKDHMGLEKLRARSVEGIHARINTILFTFIFGIAFNKKYRRNLLNLKGILM